MSAPTKFDKQQILRSYFYELCRAGREGDSSSVRKIIVARFGISEQHLRHILPSPLTTSELGVPSESLDPNANIYRIKGKLYKRVV